MSFPVRALTLDLDDTVWPFAPIGARIEHNLQQWLLRHSPRTAAQFPPEAMHALRDRLFDTHPELAYDLTAIRRMTLEHALRESGADPALLDPAFEVFYATRNQVECYPDSLDGLRRIAARFPIAAVTNGNADLGRIGLAHLFSARISAHDHGAAKPEASIFLAACAQLDVAPAQVLHVGDHREMDVAGAARAGLRSAWLNREHETWDRDDLQPDLEFTTLTALADWLDATQPAATEQAVA